MELLIMGVLLLFYFVVALTSTAVAIVFIVAVVVSAIKVIKILIALANAALKEPEEKAVKKIRRLAKGTEKKKK